MTAPEGSVAAESASERPSRRRDLDLMRMFVVVGLVFFHSARVFDTGDFYVKNEPTSEIVSICISFAALWGMPLLFVVAGMGIWYSLRSRTATAFAQERIRRLLVPLVFGLLVIVPPQVWTELRGDPAYQESYWRFLTRFFDVEFQPSGFPFLIGDDPGTGLFEWGHLWFLVLLFVFSLTLLPLIWALRRPSGLRILDRVAEKVDRFWVVLAAGLPLAFFDATLGSEEDWAGWNRYSYAAFILYGYVIASDRRFGRALHQHRKKALTIGTVTFVVVGALFALGEERDGVDLLVDYDLVSVAMRAFKGLSGWLWVVTIMGLATGSAKRPQGADKVKQGPTPIDRISDYTSEAVLPIYVLHQTVIVLLAFYVVNWPIHGVFKYVALCVISLVIILVVYDVAVRRTKPTRFLFGMKPPRY